MTDPQKTTPDTGNAAADAGYPGLPRWVKMSGIIVAILVLALVAIMLIAGGDHGPSRHGGHAAEQTEQQAVTGEALTGLHVAARATG